MIRGIETNHGQIESAEFIRFAFGQHHFVEIEQVDGRVMFRLGQTHHGIQLDATEIGGDLEQVVTGLQEQLRNSKTYETEF